MAPRTNDRQLRIERRIRAATDKRLLRLLNRAWWREEFQLREDEAAECGTHALLNSPRKSRPVFEGMAAQSRRRLQTRIAGAARKGPKKESEETTMQAFRVALSGNKGVVYLCSTACREKLGFLPAGGEFVQEPDYYREERCACCGIFLNDQTRARAAERPAT